MSQHSTHYQLGLPEDQSGSTADLEHLHEYHPPGPEYPYRSPARNTQYVCDAPDCTVVFDPAASYQGSFCSEDCAYRHRGQKVLNKIESDHRWCATCFRQIKTIDRPEGKYELKVEGPKGRNDENVKKDCLVGYQYKTEHTTWGVDEGRSESEGRVFENPERIEFRRWACTCGNVDPTARNDILNEVDLQTTILSLLSCLRHLSDEGVIHTSPSWPRLRDTLREHGRDWQLAVGRALYD